MRTVMQIVGGINLFLSGGLFVAGTVQAMMDRPYVLTFGIATFGLVAGVLNLVVFE